MKKKKILPTEIETTVRGILAKYTDVLDEDVELTSKLDEDLGMDSIDRVELEMDIEKAFGFTFEESQTDNVTTVGELIELITSITDGTL